MVLELGGRRAGEMYFQSARKGPIRVTRFTSRMADLPGVNVGVVDMFVRRGGGCWCSAGVFSWLFHSPFSALALCPI